MNGGCGDCARRAQSWERIHRWGVETFHTGSKHNDHRLAEAIRDTEAWGGLMSDLIDTVESNSTLIETGNQFDNETRVRDLIGRMRAAGIDTRGQTWIAIGRKTQRALDTAQAILRDEEISILAIPHYSGAANGAIVRRFAQSHSVTENPQGLSVGQELSVDQKYRLLVQDVLKPIK